MYFTTCPRNGEYYRKKFINLILSTKSVLLRPYFGWIYTFIFFAECRLYFADICTADCLAYCFTGILANSTMVCSKIKQNKCHFCRDPNTGCAKLGKTLPSEFKCVEFALYVVALVLLRCEIVN